MTGIKQQSDMSANASSKPGDTPLNSAITRITLKITMGAMAAVMIEIVDRSLGKTRLPQSSLARNIIKGAVSGTINAFPEVYVYITDTMHRQKKVPV